MRESPSGASTIGAFPFTVTVQPAGATKVCPATVVLGVSAASGCGLALAASKAGRFQQFHDTLYAAGRPSAETLQKAAAAAGIPFQPPQSPEIDGELKRNYQIANALGASGTPLFIVGDRVLNGAVGYDVLKKAIADARAKAD